MRSKQVKVIGVTERCECEINQASVMITLCVKFNVHSCYAKQAIMLKLPGRWTHPRKKIWLIPENTDVNYIYINYINYKLHLFLLSGVCLQLPTRMCFLFLVSLCVTFLKVGRVFELH